MFSLRIGNGRASVPSQSWLPAFFGCIDSEYTSLWKKWTFLFFASRAQNNGARDEDPNRVWMHYIYSWVNIVVWYISLSCLSIFTTHVGRLFSRENPIFSINPFHILPCVFKRQGFNSGKLGTADSTSPVSRAIYVSLIINRYLNYRKKSLPNTGNKSGESTYHEIDASTPNKAEATIFTRWNANLKLRICS